MTNMVRPRIAPLRRPSSFEYVSAGSDQLFVGPASSFVGVQMKVNCSTRATSFGLERCKYEHGTFLAFGLIRRFGTADSRRRRNSRGDIFHEATPKAFVNPIISGLSILRLEQGTIFA